MINKDTQAKHWAGKSLNIIQSYWDSPPATKRSKWFVEQLKTYNNFASICEVGFLSGRNLRYISESFPAIKVAGIEINEQAVKFAHQKLPSADLRCMDLHNFRDVKDSFDIVFTSGVLIHVPPDNLVDVLDSFVAVANKYVMHIETIGKNTVSAGPKELKPTYKISDQIQWATDIEAAYKQLGFKNLEIIKLPDDCKTNGASELIIVTL